MPEFKSADDLKKFFEDNPHVNEIHFTEDGEHHINVHGHGDKLVTRIEFDGRPGPEIVGTYKRSDLALLESEEEVKVDDTPEGGGQKPEGPVDQGTGTPPVNNEGGDGENHDNLIPGDGAMAD